MKSFSKLIFPCLLFAHILIRFGLNDVQASTQQSPEQLICAFQDQLQAEQAIQAREAVLAVVE